MGNYKTIMKTTQDIHLKFSLKDANSFEQFKEDFNKHYDIENILLRNAVGNHDISEIVFDEIKDDFGHVEILFKALVNIHCIGYYEPPIYTYSNGDPGDPGCDNIEEYVSGWIDSFDIFKVVKELLDTRWFGSFVDESTISIDLDDIDEYNVEFEDEPSVSDEPFWLDY